MLSTSSWTDSSLFCRCPLEIHRAAGKEVDIVLSVTDLGTLKLAMLRQLDANLQQNYHQTLLEVLNELRMRSIVAQPDPTPDKVFSVILQAHILARKCAPDTSQLRDALERMVCGKYGLCIRCGKEISVSMLLKDPSRPCCLRCQAKANG